MDINLKFISIIIELFIMKTNNNYIFKYSLKTMMCKYKNILSTLTEAIK